MKNAKKIGALGTVLLLTASMYSQSDSLGMPGDNLDLTAVLSIFKQSSSVEDFEKRLNSADSRVNNLDLNGDNQVDYLRVVDYGKDDFHSIVIQDPVSRSESQDVAVIELVKKDKNTAHIQIVGDETLYGKDYIIEPEDQEQLNSTASKKSNVTNDDVYEKGNSSTHVMINVWAWPGVSYIYSPGYVYWVSPWYWGYYPGWYSPWRPYGWRIYHAGFYGYNYGFYGYRRHYYAFPHVHNYYYGKRVSSGYVRKTAPHYAHRNSISHNRNVASRGNGNRTTRHNNSAGRSPGSGSHANNRSSQNKTGGNTTNRSANTHRQDRSTAKTHKGTNGKSHSSTGGHTRSSGGQKMSGSQHSGSGYRSSGGGNARGGGSGAHPGHR